MHAGHSETALMLALAPDTVHMERAVANFPPDVPCPSCCRPTAAPRLRLDRARLRPQRRHRRPAAGHAASRAATILERWPTAGRAAITDLYALQWVVRDAPSWGHGHQHGHIDSRPPAGRSHGTCLAHRMHHQPSRGPAMTSLRTPSAACAPPPSAWAFGAGAHAQEKFTYMTNWYAQAEHGGFYQAVATGHLQEVRAGRHDQDGRPAGQHHAADGRRPGRLHHGLERPADDDRAREAGIAGGHGGRRRSRRTRRC